MARQLVISLVLFLFSQEWERIFFWVYFYCLWFQLLRDTDLASFSHGSVRHNLSVLKIKFWSDVDHINHLCDTQAPRSRYRKEILGIIIVKRQIKSQSYYDKYHREVTWKFQARPPPLISQQFWLLLVYQPRISSLFVIFYKPPPHLT